MSRLLRSLVVSLAVLAPTALVAQQSPATIAPGMPRDSVVARFGTPSSERTRGDFTYLYFASGRERQVGMSDLVILERGKVVDAVLRSPQRAYSGTSSSPRAIPPAEAARRKQAPPPTAAHTLSSAS